MDVELPVVTVGRHLPDDAYNVEAIVNGYWNQILTQSFPFPEYIICPEYWTQRGAGGSRPDLVVIKRSNGQVVLVYEGKKAGANPVSQFNAGAMRAGTIANLDQVKKYLESMTGKRGQIVYGILAAGTKFIILAHDLGRGQTKRIIYSSLSSVDDQLYNMRDFDGSQGVDEGAKIVAAIAARNDFP